MHVDEERGSTGTPVLERLRGRARRHLLGPATVVAAVRRPSVDLRLHVVICAIYVYMTAFGLHAMLEYRRLTSSTPSDLLWPLSWAEPLPWRPTAALLTAAVLLTAMVAAAAYHRRSARVVAAVAFVLYAAGVNSFGKINHGFHHLLIPVVLLAFAPSIGAALSRRQAAPPWRAASWVFAAQALVALTYSMSGWHKVWTGVQQLLAGKAGLFSLESLPAIIAARVLQTADSPPLAEPLVQAAALSSILYGLTVLVELTFVLVVWWPRVARLWAAAIIGFHLAVYWSMYINFTHSIATVFLLFFLSPFLADRGPDAEEAPVTA